MSRPTPPTYKTGNWPTYNEALKRRGSLTIWFDPEMNWEATPTGRRSRQQSYSDAAIQMCLSMKVLFGMTPSPSAALMPSSRLAGMQSPGRPSCEEFFASPRHPYSVELLGRTPSLAMLAGAA